MYILTVSKAWEYIGLLAEECYAAIIDLTPLWKDFEIKQLLWLIEGEAIW